MITLEEKIISIGGYLLSIFFPPAINILAVRIYWEIFQSKSEFIEHHIKENINFLISYQIYMLSFIAFYYLLKIIPDFIYDKIFDLVLPGILGIIPFLLGLGFIGFLLMIFLIITPVYIVAIIATLAGKRFRFPLTINFIK